MTVLVIVAVLVIAAMIATHILLVRRMAAFFVARVVEQDEAEQGRRNAIYKQQKAFTQRLAAAERATAKMVDETRSTSDTLKADARQLHTKADALLRGVKERG